MKTWKKLKENPKLWDRYFVREKVLRETRNFFLKEGFHEVETPLLNPALPPESYLEVFETELIFRDKTRRRAFLTASPEMSLKKLLAAGIGDCFEICKSFRNQEDRSLLHNPEFTMIEWYRVNADYRKVMEDVENWIYYLAANPDIQCHCESDVTSDEAIPSGLPRHFVPRNDKLQNSGILTYKNKTLDLTPPWERISIKESFQKYAGLDLDSHFDLEKMKKAAKKKGYKVENNTWEELFNQIFLNEIEPHLGNEGKPTIIYDYPKDMAALAKLKKSDPNYAERFEFYLFGIELGDAYTELTDWKEQEERFKNEVQLRKKLGKIEFDYDRDFIEALKSGLPDCSGIAVGLDRLIMILSGADNVADTLFFPAVELFS